MKRSLCALAVLTKQSLSAFGVHIFIYALVSICLWYLHVFSMHWYFLIFSYYLTVFELALIGDIEKHRVHSACWQFQWWGSICLLVSMTPMNSEEITLCSGSVNQAESICLWCLYLYICTGIHLPLVSTCFLYALVFPDIFLLFDCFELALIGDIEKCRVHSACWQFQWGVPSAF